MNLKFESIFHSQEEKLISILGQNYFDSILRDSALKKSVLILSDKRLYQRGVVYEKEGRGNFKKTQGQKIVDIEEVTGTSFISRHSIVLLFFSVVLLVLIPMIAKDSSDPTTIIFILLFIDIVFWLWFFYTKKKFFQIEYAGGAIATEIGWYKVSDIENFQKQITIEKDKLKSNISSDTIECPFCAERIKKKAKFCRFCNREL